MKTERDYYFDNVKFILIFLVVFGHLLTNTIGKFNFDRSIYSFIYLFHMPCFIIVSGYFSKNLDNRYKKVLNLFVLYLEFQILQFLFKKYILDESIDLTFAKPYWSLWFLLAVVFWKLLLPYLIRIKYIFFISLIFGVLVGYDKNIENYLALSRIITFLPFFLFGYYLKKETLLKIINSKKIRIVLYLSTICIFVLAFLFAENINYQWMYASYPYEDLSVKWYAGGFRIILYALGFILSLFIFSISPSKKIIFTNVGTNSLNIYLMHGFIIPIITMLPVISMPIYFRIPIYIIATFIIIFFFTNNLVSKIAKPLLNPKINIILKKNLASER